MAYMQRRRSRVKSNPDQLDFFPLLDEPPTTVPEVCDSSINSPLVSRVHRLTGWSPERCVAVIEANGGIC